MAKAKEYMVIAKSSSRLNLFDDYDIVERKVGDTGAWGVLPKSHCFSLVCKAIALLNEANLGATNTAADTEETVQPVCDKSTALMLLEVLRQLRQIRDINDGVFENSQEVLKGMRDVWPEISRVMKTVFDE